MFLYLSLYYSDKVYIGRGNDMSDIQSVIKIIDGLLDFEPDDVYVNTNEMWFAVIGGSDGISKLRMDVEIISIDLSSECWFSFLLKYR